MKKNKKLSIGAIVLAFMIASITNINASEIISEQSTDVAYVPTHPTNEETKNASKAISEDSRAKYSASTKAGEDSTLYLSKDGYGTKSDGSYWSGAGFDYVYSGDTITYDINLANEGTEVLENIPVRDTMLEDMPSYLTLYKDIVVQDTDTHTDVPYSGSLEDGDFSVNSLQPNQSIDIVYVVKTNNIPNDVTTIRNAVSDNGEDPNDLTCISIGGGSARTRTSSCAVSNVKVATRPTVVTKTIKDTTTNTETDSIIGKNNMEYEYTINVTNPTSTYIDDVPVRDSLLENLSGEIIWDGNLEVTYSDGSSLKPTYRGDITNGTFSIDEIDANKTVQIKYSLTFTNLQPGVSNALLNTATDTSLDPTGLCDLDTADEVDCDSAEVISEPDLSIDKTVSGLGLDGTVNVGDQLTYKISVTNNNTVDVNDVPVRDSMLENLPSYLTWDNNINITCSNIISCEKGFKGSLADGTFTLDQINAGETTKIAYNIDVVDSIPEEVDNIINIVTNTSEDPTEVCVEDGYPQENGKTCDYTESYVSAETEINKSVVDSNNNDVVEPGDILEYTLTVFNPSEIDSGKIAFGVKVKDSLVMNPLSWLTFNDDVVLTRDGEEMVKGYDYIGDLSKKTGIYIEEIAPQEKVEIKYSFTVGDSIPDDIESVINVATDNNQDPNEITECDEESTDCASVTLPVVETEEPTVPSENDSEVDSEVGGGQDIEEPSEESSGVVSEESSEVVSEESSEVVSEESSEVVSEEGSIMATGQQAKLLLISFNLIAIISVALLLKFRLNNN